MPNRSAEYALNWPESAHTAALRLAETPVTHSSEWDELVRWIAPRRVVRVDPDSSHSYALISPMDAGEPQAPYALHLTDLDHRFQFLVFDLDVSCGGQASVWRDADAITTLLAEHGLDHFVSRSGPGGGIHVWAPVSGEHGLDPVEVTRLARAAERRPPTLTPRYSPAIGVSPAPHSPAWLPN